MVNIVERIVSKAHIIYFVSGRLFLSLFINCFFFPFFFHGFWFRQTIEFSTFARNTGRTRSTHSSWTCNFEHDEQALQFVDSAEILSFVKNWKSDYTNIYILQITSIITNIRIVAIFFFLFFSIVKKRNIISTAES